VRLSTARQRPRTATGYSPAVRPPEIRAGRSLIPLVVLAAAAAATLTGCGAEGRQASTDLPPMASSSAEPTLELTPLGPADLPMPEEARIQDPAGAEAFLRYYLEVYNHAQRTLDSTHLRDLSRGCATCERIASDMDSDAKAGYAYEGGEVSIQEVSTPFLRTPQKAEIAFAVTQAALTVTSDGTPVDGLSFPETSSTTDGAILTWDDERSTWLLAQWDAA
jgi:hypothetical protein